jgi:pimeloyl-ACP methyl ester carboxylesterase
MSALARRGILGVRFEPRPAGPGVLVTAVTEHGPAARAGIVAGDLLLAADETPFTDAHTFKRWASTLRAHQRTTLTLSRDNGPTIVRDVIVDERPRERAAGVEHRYTHAMLSDGARLRVIVTVPEPPTPVVARVLWLPGYRRDSCDWPTTPDDPLRQWIEHVARAGLAVVRVERRGLGDSEGDGDAQGFDDERRDLVEGALRCEDRTLEGLPWIIYGYSLGGLSAPLVAQTFDARGVAVWGSGIDTWTEYLDALMRRRMRLLACDERSIERAVRAQQSLYATVHLSGGSVAQALARNPSLIEYARNFGLDPARDLIDGRSARFWHEVYRCPTASALAALDVPLLALWGECDWLTTEDEHERIARTAKHGRYHRIARTDHGYRACESAQASLRGESGPYAPAAAEALISWVREILL